MPRIWNTLGALGLFIMLVHAKGKVLSNTGKLVHLHTHLDSQN